MTGKGTTDVWLVATVGPHRFVPGDLVDIGAMTLRVVETSRCMIGVRSLRWYERAWLAVCRWFQ